MKRTAVLISCIIFIFFISCTQNRDEKSTDTGKEVAESVDVAEVEIEEFSEFVEKFSQEESFQLQRIKFPISVIVPDTGTEGMAQVKELIGRYEWEQLDLSYDSTFLTRPFDQYYQVVRFINDTAVVEIRGIDNGIFADYYFELIDNKWYLVTLYEASF
ncbi:MAG: DUF4348 domain-containing protein [Fermentimonas sp.]|nr:DUF4348 domain-containing protein [Fermentimonas sp.]